jgi:hypothetical protein
MTVLSLGFLTDEYSQIKGLLYSLGSSSNEEFELRFGKLDKTFDTNFSQAKFFSIINNLDFLNIHKKKEQTVDTVEYKGRYRKITLLKRIINGIESTEKVYPTYENKIKSKNIDINVVGEIYENNSIMKGIKSTLRFSSSKEQEITEKDWNNSSDKVNLSVKRVRTTYFMDNYKVDLTTKHYGGENPKIVFEVEVEFNNDYIKSIIAEEKGFIKFMGELKTVLGFVYSSSTIYSEYYFNAIASEINSIRYPADVRPKNISDEDVLNTKLQGYAVTNKLDGVGYNITFVQINLAGTELIVLVAYNSTDIFSISTIKASSLIPEEKKILKSFSKAEIKYIPSTKATQVHFFDNLLYGNERTFEKDLFMRLNKAIEINNICIKHFLTASVPVSYEVKAFEIPRGDIIDTMKSVVNKMSDRYDVFDLVDYNDGIIFQPLGPYNMAPALKWKFPSKVTIDFLFRKEYENDNLITYKLCSKTKPGNFIQFKDDITGIEHTITVCKRELFDGIPGSSLEEKVVEVGVHNNEWSIHRIRFDKVPEKTNHIKTAQVTFVDILYRFTLPYLEQLIKFSRGQGEKPIKQRIDLTPSRKEPVEEPVENSEGLPKEHFPKGEGYIIRGELKNKKMTMEKNNEILSFIKDTIKSLKYSEKGIIDINPLTGSTAMTFTNFFKYVYAVKSNNEDDTLDTNFNVFYTDKDLYIIDEYENVNSYKANILFINNLFESKNIDDILNKFSNFLIIVASKKTLGDYTYFKETSGMKLYSFYNPKKSLENLRVMANLIKKEMIESTRGKVVADIGSGVGGDLFKYSNSETKELFLIEPSTDNIKTLNIRLKEGARFLKKLPYKVLNAGGEESEKICSFVGKHVDFVNMFFSLTFFFKNRDMLMNLVNTIDCLLKDDGVFMGTVMDGHLVERELEKDDIITKDYEIKKVSIEGKKEFYSKEISIDFKNTVTATYQTEYLVFLKEFEFLLASKGINLEKIMNFNEYDTQSLSKEEKFLNGLYSMFVFRKTGVLRNSRLNLVPIYKNKQLVNEYWYRVASPPDGSCLFHSVVMNLLGDEAGPQTAYDIRTVLSNTLTLEEYTNIQDGNLAIIKLHEILLENMSVSCFNQVPNGVDDKELKNKVEKIIEKYSKYRMQEFRKAFVKELVEEGFDKEEVKEVFKGFYLSTYLKFSENLANKNYWADQSMILLLAEKLKINIVLISSRTLEVYDYTDKYNPDYVSIVLLYIDDAHFDPLCKKVSPYDEKCQYTFSLDELKSII